MADKKTGKSTASHKKAVKEFQKEGNPDFQKSGGLDFQPRASAVFQEKTGASQKPGASEKGVWGNFWAKCPEVRCR